MSTRRKEGERNNSEQRIIERFTNTRIRDSYVQIRTAVKLLLGLSVIGIIYHLVKGFYQGGHYIGLGLLNASILSFISTYLSRYQTKITFFLENDSVQNLEEVSERAQGLWMVFVFFATLLMILGALSHF